MKEKQPTVELFDVDKHKRWLVGGNVGKFEATTKPVMNNVRIRWQQ